MVLKAANTSYGTTVSKGSGRRTYKKKGSSVTENRAKAQRAKLDKQTKIRQAQEEQEQATQQIQKKTAHQDLQAKRRTLDSLIEAYIGDHAGGNHGPKTLEWHRTALGLLQQFLSEELEITQIDDVEADDLSAWFAHLRSTPGAWEVAERTHDPDLRALSPRFLPLAGASGNS